ncbi:MAG: KpsF/GutQ family sugar-phosphate isomerase [Deltaproteobacteria bacterium]|nr:KpsF/GutQ family sugar-phosphate isomerase [Deltaproteobacteria bacterium]
MSIIEEARRVLRVEADAVLSLMDSIGGDFEKAVEMIFACKGKVVITGMGKSGLICQKIASTMASTGTPAFFLHPAEGVHGDLGMLARGDVVMAVSNSGETEEVIRILPVIRRLGLNLISVAGKIDSTLAKRGDAFLHVAVKEEACPLGLAPTASTTATLALGDALAVALMYRRGFKEEDFAFYHPAGSLGKSLLMKVSDLMHTDDRIPVVYENSSVKDAIYEMSSKGFGVTAVLSENGEFVGVISDGDLRRALEKDGNIINAVASDIMTKNPKKISPHALAAKALGFMEERKITSLFVDSGEGGRPVGIVHLHDLLQSGVV